MTEPGAWVLCTVVICATVYAIARLIAANTRAPD